MKRSYIPQGCDQQARQQTGVWLPRRVDGAPEEAHGCYEPPDDRPIEDGGGLIVWLVCGIAAVCGVAMALHLAFRLGVL